MLETKIHSLIIKLKDDPIYSEQATIVSIDDEAGGIFYAIKQSYESAENGKIVFDSEDWPAIVDAVNRLREEWADQEGGDDKMRVMPGNDTD